MRVKNVLGWLGALVLVLGIAMGQLMYDYQCTNIKPSNARQSYAKPFTLVTALDDGSYATRRMKETFKGIGEGRFVPQEIDACSLPEVNK